jgi:hypothetical protein
MVLSTVSMRRPFSWLLLVAETIQWLQLGDMYLKLQ